MIDSQYIGQLEKHYTLYLKNTVLGEDFQPIVLRGGRNKPDTTPVLHQAISQFRSNEKRQNTRGWVIVWEDWNSKSLGKQIWPSAISVETEEDFLHLVKKEREAAAFKGQLQQLLKWNSNIREWLSSRVMLVLALREAWPDICAVVDYLLQHDVAGHYPRSIPVPVHTKFIEHHKKVIHSILQHLNKDRFPSMNTDLDEALLLKKKPFLFVARWLDEGLAAKLTSGMDIFAVSVAYLRQQSWRPTRVILVENETNLYLFPSIPGTLVICSYGKALSLLKEIDFLHHTQLFYWGDMDEAGFGMLNDIRHYYEKITSLFMDDVTLAYHQHELDKKQKPYKRKDFPLLKPGERAAYELLLPRNEWLEQERMRQSYIQERLQGLLV